MTTNFIGVLLPDSPEYTVNTGFSTELYDAEGGQTIIVQAGASLQLVGALGANTIRLFGNASDWQVYRDGSTLVTVNTDGSRVEIPANGTAQTIAFADTSLALRVEVKNSVPTVMLGTQLVDTVPAPVGGVPPVGSSEQAPWTLILPTNLGIFASDGSASGTKYLLQDGAAFAGHPVIANAALTRAVMPSGKLYGTDGTAAGTAVIADVSLFDQTYYKAGNKIVFADGGYSYAKGVVTDGTKAGTTVLADVPQGLFDPATQSLWGGVSTAPYGYELFRTVVTDSGAQSAMVKDILPGSASGLPYAGNPPMAVLANGKVVFAGNDGAGSEPWVSDGTAAGTFRLADLARSSSGSGPSSFHALGQRVVFSAYVDGAGQELVATDGTRDGTKVLDVNLGGNSSSPTILGTNNGTLYFTAQVTSGSAWNYTLMSTDGTAVHEIARLDSGTALLAWAGDKVFLKSTDDAHGEELWVVNLADGTTGLVKDILPGTGSALADTNSYSVSLVAGRLEFSAYIAATEKAYFLSDGTAAGTWQISKQSPGQIVPVGKNFFFADSDGVHVVDANGQVTLLGTPVTSQVTYPYDLPKIQVDDDQAFFLSGNGALYASNGAATVHLADKSVTAFKVVADNAVFFTEAMVDGSQSLWFSDGTVAGTRFITTLPQGWYDLAHAVGLHTPGVPLPAEADAPVLSYARVNGRSLTVGYTDDSPLDASHLPGLDAFDLSGTDAAITGIAVNAEARTVVLTLSQDVKSSDNIVLSYTDPSAGNDAAAIQDFFGNDAASFANHIVQNITPDNVAPVLAAASVAGATLTLSYTESGALDGAHLASASAFKLGGTSATVTGVALDASSGTKLVLTLSQPVLSTDNVLLSYTDPTSGNDAAAVQDAAGNDAASVTGFAVQNNTAQLHGKAPWTLLVPTSKGVFASDGTADGSRLIATQSGYPRVAANADHSAAVVIDWKYDSTTQKGDYFALGLDGSGNAPTVLAHGLASSLPRVFGKEIVVTNSGDVTTSGMVTDGTVAGTHLAATLPSGWIDTTHQTIWSSSFSDPYGYELYVTRISAAGAVTSMVKDILPGSGSGFVNATGSLLLPNGKLVFVGNDLAGGYEPWVSDGTEAGTMQLADLQPGANTAYPQLLAVFGSLAALSSVAYKPDDPTVSLGRELVITDGTAAGTHVLDIAPGGDSSNPQVVGAAGSTLYFTANALTGGLPTRALFSTDGTSSTRLADVTDTVTLLGQVGNKTFLSISDATHGAELWAVDGNGTLGLVKDILPGTGSGLSGAISPLVVGNELVFQAYVSATTRSLFMSDGTADGTVELGAATTKTQQAGHLLVYADGTNVYGLDGAAVAPQPVQLVTGSIGYAQMQADADQVFFEMANGDLYATDGTAGGTAALGHSVSTFKVVGENALYFVEQVTGGTGYSLNYSDGTVAGTYFVSYVDADFASHLGDGVVVHTVGVPPTQH